MKSIFTILIIFWCHIALLGQDVKENTVESIFVDADSPSPVGGMEAVHSWISKNANKKMFTRTDTLDCSTLRGGNVYIGFVIDEHGNLKNPEVAKGIGEPYDSEALRLIKEMKLDWIPASKDGQKIAVKMIIPISFCNFKKRKR